VDEVVADPHLRHRQMIVDVEERRQVGVMVKLSETPGALRTPSPERGQHTQQLLRELGYDDEAVAALRQAQAIG
jgi:crotonobetainyl-CoA:carnitine CoA-transferase CaiB-like acyl-CoA transferase